MAVIACRGCDSPDCRGCNTYILNNMLKAGKFKAIKNENNTINATADVVEVRHGRWIGFPDCLKFPSAYSDDHIVCSICEECFSILDNDTERFDLCPNCGAKMEVDGK